MEGMRKSCEWLDATLASGEEKPKVLGQYWLNVSKVFRMGILPHVKRGTNYARPAFTLIVFSSLMLSHPAIANATSSQSSPEFFVIDTKAFILLAGLLLANIVVPVAKFFILRWLQRKSFLASVKATTENTLHHFGQCIAHEDAKNVFDKSFAEAKKEGLDALAANKGTHIPQLYTSPKYSWMLFSRMRMSMYLSC